MFNKKTYIQRRASLKKKVGSGIALFLANNEAPMNYADNTYHYRQDSTFSYFFGLSIPNVAGILDFDEGKEILFGNDFTIGDIVWMGPQPTMKQLSAQAGLKYSQPYDDLAAYLNYAIAQGRKVHFISQYRHENILTISKLLGIDPFRISEYASVPLMKAIIELRSVKTKEELDEIEKAISISFEMHTAAMRFTKAGMIEQEISGFLEGISLSLGSGTSFPIIFTKNGQTLHNHYHGNILADGDLIIHDSGAETSSLYASDITRTFPVSGRFTPMQRDIYQIVLNANMEAIKTMKPGITNKAVHLKVAAVIAQGLKDLGIMKGNVNDAVKNGAHALFFVHGLGHLLGLDVHDMENFGENYTGYDDKNIRSTQFGLKSLRYGKPLVPGNVVTDEPGIYFIPQLIDMWKAEKKFTEYINYAKVEKYKNFGGVRIEDDIVITKTGCKVLGVPIPKTVDDVEEIASDKI
jgi:Xaa-Pro aminopeptidase